MTLQDVLYLLIAVLGGAVWGWVLRELRGDKHWFMPPITAERLTNLLLSAILGVLVAGFIVYVSGCSVDSENAYELPPPEARCGGLTFEACLARVNLHDAGVDQ